MSAWSRSSGYVAALAPAVWGSTYLVTTELLPNGRPLLASLIRALPAGLLLLFVVRGSLPRGRWVWRSLVLGTLNIGVFFALLFVTAYRLPGGIAAMVGSIQPIIVIGLSAVVLKSRVQLLQIAAAVLGTGGVVLLVARSHVTLDPIGIAAALGAALSMAAGIVLTKKWGRPVPLLVFTGWQLIAGGLVLLPLTLILEGLPTTITPLNIAGYLYLCLIGSCLAYTIWFRGIEQLTAPAVSFLGLVSPVVAAVLGYLVLNQALVALQLVGMAMIVSAVIIGQRPPRTTSPGETQQPRSSSPGGLSPVGASAAD